MRTHESQANNLTKTPFGSSFTRRRTPALEIVKNSHGFAVPPVDVVDSRNVQHWYVVRVDEYEFYDRRDRQMVRRHSLSFIGNRDVTRPGSGVMEKTRPVDRFTCYILTRGARSGILAELILGSYFTMDINYTLL